MFAADGCVIPNIPTQTYRAVFVPKCEHSKTRGMVIDFTATDAESATRYAMDYYSNNHVDLQRVYVINPETVICRRINT